MADVTPMRFGKVIRLAAVLAAVVALGAGCASTRGDDDSDLPWNMSQPWESSPGIPGGMMNAY